MLESDVLIPMSSTDSAKINVLIWAFNIELSNSTNNISNIILHEIHHFQNHKECTIDFP